MIFQRLNKLAKILIYLLSLAPLLVCPKFLFPYVFTKSIFFEITVLILFVILFYLILKQGFCFNKKNYLFYSWLVFIAILFLTAVFGKNFYRSFWGNFERMEGVLIYLFLTFYFFAIIILFKKREDWHNFFRFNIIVSLLVCCYGFLQKLGAESYIFLPATGPRLESTFGNAAFLASYLIFIVYLSLILYLKEGNTLINPALEDRQKTEQAGQASKAGKWKIFYIFSLLINLLALFLTETRGAILGLFFGLMALAIVLFFKLKKKNRIQLGAILGVVILLIVFVFINRDNVLFQKISITKRLTSVSLQDASVKNRLLTWQSAWQGSKDKPILGYGLENQKYVFNKYFNPQISDQWFDRTHNTVLDLLIVSGVLGLISYLTIFILAFYWLYQISKNEFILALVLFSLLTAYFVQNLFVFDTVISHILFISILAYISYLRIGADDLKEIKLKFKGKKFVFLTAAAVVIFISFKTITMPVKASYLTVKANNLFNVDKDLSYNNYQKAMDLESFGRRKITIVLSDQVIFYLKNKKRVDKAASDKFFSLAKSSLEQCLKKEPEDMQLILIFALLNQHYSENNEKYLNEAINMVENNIGLSPNRLEVYYSLAQSYLLKKDYAKTLDYLWQAQNIMPKRDKYLKMAAIYSKISDIKGLKEVYDNYRKDFPEIDLIELKKMANYFFTAELYQEIVPMLKLIIENEPQDPNNYISLALVYKKIGKTEQAKEAVKKILEINPAYAPQVEEFIKNL